MISRRPATILPTTDFLYRALFKRRSRTLHWTRYRPGTSWDKKNQTIVSNESAEIIRMFNTAFDAHGAPCRRFTIRLSCARKLTS